MIASIAIWNARQLERGSGHTANACPMVIQKVQDGATMFGRQVILWVILSLEIHLGSVNMEPKSEIQRVIKGVNAIGIKANRRLNCEPYIHSIVCTQNNMPSTKQGLSFWVTLLASNWYLACWSYRYWKIGENTDIVEVCRDFMAFGQDASSPPAEVFERHQLTEISIDSFREASKFK